jgi:hypothetical protein
VEKMTDIKTEDLWKNWMGALQATVLGGKIGKGQQFSAASTTLNVDLANSDPDITNYSIYGIGDVVPVAGPSYAPASGVLASYATFLDWIDLGGDQNPNLDSQINIAAEELNSAQENFNKVQEKAGTQFANYLKIHPGVVFEDWAGQNYPAYQEAYNALTGADAQYNSLMIQKYGAGYSVLQNARNKVSALNGAQNILSQNAYNMKVKVGTIAPPGSQKVLAGGDNPTKPDNLKSTFQPSYTLDSSFRQKFAEWQAASVKKTGGKVSISVSAKTQTYSYDQFGWDASIKASWIAEFFRIFAEGSTSGERVNINTSNKDFSLSIEFTGLGTFGISPGLWWDHGSLISTYKKLKPEAPDFFGETGSLARFPYQIVVGFEPTIKLKMEANDYKETKKSWQAKATASIGIGPFRIGSATVSTSGKKEDINWDDASAAVTIGPIKSTVPVLLAVVSQRLGN